MPGGNRGERGLLEGFSSLLFCFPLDSGLPTTPLSSRSGGGVHGLFNVLSINPSLATYLLREWRVQESYRVSEPCSRSGLLKGFHAGDWLLGRSSIFTIWRRVLLGGRIPQPSTSKAEVQLAPMRYLLSSVFCRSLERRKAASRLWPSASHPLLPSNFSSSAEIVEILVDRFQVSDIP